MGTNAKLSDLTASTALAGGELIYVAQSGNSRKATLGAAGASLLEGATVAAVYVTDLTALKALDTTKHSAAIVYDAGGRNGRFAFDDSDHSTNVTADTEEGIYVPPTTDATGASGAWVRQFPWAIEGAEPEWFGAAGDNTTDDSTAIQAAMSLTNYVKLGANTYFCGTTGLTVSGKAFSIVGVGMGLSNLRWNGDVTGFGFTQSDEDHALRMQNLSLFQSGAGVGTAISISGDNTDRVQHRVKLENVEARGTTGPATDGWLIHLNYGSALHGTFDGLHFVGYHAGTGTAPVSTKGIVFDDTGAPAEILIQNSWMFYVQHAVDVDGTEGMFINNCNFVAVDVGVYGNASAGSSPQLNVRGCHISVHDFCIDVRRRAQAQIIGNLLYNRTGETVTQIRLRDTCDYAVIANNTFVKNSGTVTGIEIGVDGACQSPNIFGNTFQGVDTAISLQANCNAAGIGFNMYQGVTTEITQTNATNTRIANWNLSDNLFEVQNTTSSTNTVEHILRLSRRSRFAPASGIGSGMEFEVETAADNYEVGATIEAVTTDVTGGSEDFDLVLLLMAAGAAVAEKFRFKGTGQFDLASGGVIRVNSTQVIQARETGWTASTGTANKGAYATHTAATISDPPTQTEVQNIADALEDASQRIKALEDALFTHGLIGA